MKTIMRSALVPHTPKCMFELVNDVVEYPKFLPWCKKTTIIMQTPNEIEAMIEIAWSGITKSFTTRNQLYPHERMDIKLIDGPFKHLEGNWSFQPLGDQGCKVQLELEFELTGMIFDKLFEPVFHHIANTLVESFCRRANELYDGR
jgi:ribosome-associated toxin RatA of RatAB toxin-antitoxin module